MLVYRAVGKLREGGDRMTEIFDDDQAAADALDVAVTDAIAGDRSDPTLAWLTDAFTVVPSAEATDRIAEDRPRAGRPWPFSPCC